MIRRNAAFLSAAVFFASVGSAHAQPLDKDADADRLFKEGQKLMEEHRFADACPKLESAYKKDQQLGTLLNLAYCHKEQGSTFVAWTEFREAETKAIELKRNDRRDFAREKMKDLEKNLGKLIVNPSSKYDVYEVDLEDRRIWDAEKGIAFAAEPGQRKMTFHAKGKKPGVVLVTVASAKESRDRIQHVQAPEMADDDPVVAPPDPTPSTSAVTAPPAADKTSTWSSQKTFAIVAGVAGVAGIAIGTVFGLKALSRNACTDHDANTFCDQSTHNSQATAQTISTIGIVAGTVLIGGGVVLWLTAPKSSRTSGTTAPAGPTFRADLGPTWAGFHGTF